MEALRGVCAGGYLTRDGCAAAELPGARVRFSGGSGIVSDGPFVETKELIAGFWMWNVTSLVEAI
jgi:hypothetical protein